MARKGISNMMQVGPFASKSAQKVVFQLLRKINTGRLVIQTNEEDGSPARPFIFGSRGASGYEVTVTVKDSNFWNHVYINADLVRMALSSISFTALTYQGLAEAYIYNEVGCNDIVKPITVCQPFLVKVEDGKIYLDSRLMVAH